MQYVVAVDSGGTFSDCVVIDGRGAVTTAKAPSTPHDYAEGVLAAIAAAAERLGFGASDLLARSVLFAHGTTVATNALLTRSGARAGLLCTAGHEDALLIGRTFQKVAGRSEDDLLDIAALDKPDPVIPRHLIEGLHERVDWRGQVVVPLRPDEVARGVRRLVAAGVEAIAVCFLWSFANPAHEQAVKEYIRRLHPDVFVTVSSEIAPLAKEYERTATVALNAYLSPRTAGYLGSLERRLRRSGYGGRPVIMQSSGGVLPIDVAADRAVALLTSGPAGGVIGARALARLLGHADIITTDVGGTSFDVGLIVDGEPLYADAPVFDQLQILLPVVDVATIGTGGGSIAWLEHGILRVGPRSAGAAPGPACYGLGGEEPTLTDADVVLGRINPDYFLGGRRRLDRERAARAIHDRIAAPLGLSVEEAAQGIIDVADGRMADLVRKVTIERGYDPRRFTLYAFGGAGPLHAGAYGRGAGCRAAVVPLFAAAFSAFGIAGSDLLVVEEQSEPMPAPFDPTRVATIFDRLQARAAAALAESGAPGDRRSFKRYMTLRYRGQVHEIRTPVPDGPVDAEVLEGVAAAFERLYEQRYGRGASYRRAGMQALGFRVQGQARLHPPRLSPAAAGGEDPGPARKGERPVYFKQLGGFHTTPIFAAERLQAGNRIAGPAVIEAADTTILIHPRQTATVDAYRNVVLTL